MMNTSEIQSESTVEISYPELKELFTDILAKLSEEDLRDFHEEVGAMLTVDKVTKRSRDEIVADAKAEVSLVEEQLSKTRTSVEFVVNAEKRTVVALTKFNWMEGTRVRSRGIAKAHPDDCFNEYIGKAIALRRALGNPPMYEYLNAPQPEGVCDYDKIALVPGSWYASEYGEFVTATPGEYLDPKYGDAQCQPTSRVAKSGKVIDDSARYK